MAGQRASLTAIRLELPSEDAQRHAGLATIAIGAVGEHAAAPESIENEAGVGVVVDQVARRGDLGARLPPGQIAAGVGGRCIVLQRLEREILEVRHVASVGPARSSRQYTGSNCHIGGGKSTLRRT